MLDVVWSIKLHTPPAVSCHNALCELEYIDSFLDLVWLICTLSILRRRGCVENFVPRIILDYESVTVVKLDTVILEVHNCKSIIKHKHELLKYCQPRFKS